MMKFGRPRSARSAKQAEQQSAAREVFRVLRSNLLVAIAELDNPCVVVTSAAAGEGKTSTCVGIAQSLAAAGSRVVLVDCDLRNPDSHRLLGASNAIGVTDVLVGRYTLQECLQTVRFTQPPSPQPIGMQFLAAGPQVADPTELLSSPQMTELFARLATDADVVLIDAPPVLPVADTLVIGRVAIGAVLVVEARRTPIPAAKRARDVLARSQMLMLGVVLNKFDAKGALAEYESAGDRRKYGADGEYAVGIGADVRPRARA